jgi:uncharacterized protein YndB with AHSA1/START domain
MKKSKSTVGLTKDAGWQVGMRRSLAIGIEDLWHLLTSAHGIAVWLGEAADLPMQKGSRYKLSDGTTGEIKVIHPYSHLRITWHPPAWPRPSTMQLRLVSKGSRTVLALHQERLPGAEARNQRRAFFAQVLDAYENLARNPQKWHEGFKWFPDFSSFSFFSVIMLLFNWVRIRLQAEISIRVDRPSGELQPLTSQHFKSEK